MFIRVLSPSFDREDVLDSVSELVLSKSLPLEEFGFEFWFEFGFEFWLCLARFEPVSL